MFRRERSVIVFPELRAKQVEWASAWTDSVVYALGVKWDLGSTHLPANVRRSGFVRLAAKLVLAPPHVLEIPEPLFLRESPRTVLVAVAARCGALVRRSRVEIVSYAIENNRLPDLIGRRGILRLAYRPTRFVLRRLVFPLYTRLVFGTPGARANYLDVDPRLQGRSQLVLQLPAPANAPSGIGDTPPGAGDVLFVGELACRKGVDLLIEAWQRVESLRPAARLVIIGQGPLRETVEEFVGGSPSSRVFLGFVEHDGITDRMASATVLVAPSVRAGRWREQVGLPIVEALAVGTTVVTTSESGLSSWLRDHGHFVIDGAGGAEALSDAICRALDAPLPRGDVIAPLPDLDGRVRAYELLHKG